MIKFDYGSATEQGPRKRQEDAGGFFIPSRRRILGVLADGMGGTELKRGAEAAGAALGAFGLTEGDSAARAAAAAAAVAAMGLPRGMVGTTLTAFDITRPGVADPPPGARITGSWIHIGDTRLYHVHVNGFVERVTTDHSVAMDQVLQGNLSVDEVRTHPQRNLLTRCLNGDPTPSWAMGVLHLEPGDGLILVSDGVWEPLSGLDMAVVLRQAPLGASLNRVAADILALAAKRRKGGLTDNATCLVLRISGTV